MNNQQLQEAIDKTRAWLKLQVSSQSTSSAKAKDDAVSTLAELQKIQVLRANMLTLPLTTLKEQRPRKHERINDDGFGGVWSFCKHCHKEWTESMEAQKP